MWLSKSLPVPEVLCKHKLPILAKLNEEVELNESFSLSSDTALTIYGKGQLETAYGQDEAGRTYIIPLNCKHKVMLKPINRGRTFLCIKDICEAKFLPNCIQNQIQFTVYGIEFPKNTLFYVKEKEISDIPMGISVESRGPHPVNVMLPRSVKGNFIEALQEYDENRLYLLGELKNRSTPFSVIFEQLYQDLPPHLLPNGLFRVEEIEKHDILYATAKIKDLKYLIAIPYNANMTVKVGQVVENDQLYLSIAEPKFETIDLPRAEWLCNNMSTQGRIQYMVCDLVKFNRNEVSHLSTCNELYEEPLQSQKEQPPKGLFSKSGTAEKFSISEEEINKQRKMAPQLPRRVSSLKKNVPGEHKHENTALKARIQSLYAIGEIKMHAGDFKESKLGVLDYHRDNVPAKETFRDTEYPKQDRDAKKTSQPDEMEGNDETLDSKEANYVQMHGDENIFSSNSNAKGNEDKDRAPPIPPKRSSLKSILPTADDVTVEKTPFKAEEIVEKESHIPAKNVSLRTPTDAESPESSLSTTGRQVNETHQRKQSARKIPPIPVKRKGMSTKKAKVNEDAKDDIKDLYAKVIKRRDNIAPPLIKPRKKTVKSDIGPILVCTNDGDTNLVVGAFDHNNLLTNRNSREEIVGGPRGFLLDGACSYERKSSETDQGLEKENEPSELQIEIKPENASQVGRENENNAIEDICQVLKLLKLSAYEEKMSLMQVDVTLLHDLIEDDLIQDIGMLRFEANKLLAYVKEGWRPDDKDLVVKNSSSCSKEVENWTCHEVGSFLGREIKMTKFADFCTKHQVNGKLLVKIVQQDIVESIFEDFNLDISNIQKIKLRKYVLDGWRPNV